VLGRRVRVQSSEPLRRGRLSVFFRPLVAIPYVIVLLLWNVVVSFVLPFNWIAALLLGRAPSALHEHVASYLRFHGHLTAWLCILSGRRPSPRRTLEHPFRIDVPGSAEQSRLVTLFRLPLAIPAVVLASAFNVILTCVAVISWLVSLFLGRTTAGLQELGTFCLRYQLETSAYLMLLTPRYPRLEPTPPPGEQLLIPGL
jgi:Domain of unknown function (DUF4389)